MPRIFDNIDLDLLPDLQRSLGRSERADLCVGYFNLRGWRHIGPHVEAVAGGEGRQCRIIVGMHRSESGELKEALRLDRDGDGVDMGEAVRLKRRLAEEFKEQLTLGSPSNADERALRLLARQLGEGKVTVKLHTRYRLHAKLYLCHTPDNPVLPTVAYLGSSNLTFSGLRGQGELNIDVLDGDAAAKLTRWFEARWADRFCLDISAELLALIEESWARDEPVRPYHLYLKVAYHLSQEARLGLAEFALPDVFERELFDYQAAAVSLAARHLSRRYGVLLGDVVGLGKTMMATALARVFQDEMRLRTLVICPKNLVRMWDGYRRRYGLRGARVLSITEVLTRLPDLEPYDLVVIDESHNLRNREGKRYRAIRDYVQAHDARCVLLTATPYNKAYEDLSNQLRLFVPPDRDLGVRPEALLREIGDAQFERRYQVQPRTLAAFERSPHPDDWRELMRLFLVRRTRSFIKEHYALDDGGRRYLLYPDGTKSYFPERVPLNLPYGDGLADDDADPAAALYGDDAVDTVAGLRLPRYGLGAYARPAPRPLPTPAEVEVLDGLSRAGTRLAGFTKTNLFKRLESSGHAFLLSVERHVLRNYVYIHAIENGLPLPIGSQDAALLDLGRNDEDADSLAATGGEDREGEALAGGALRVGHAAFEGAAARTYEAYRSLNTRHFTWLRSDLFGPELARDLRADSEALIGLLGRVGDWDPARDPKLDRLRRLLVEDHPDEKVLVFSQFADTVDYLVGHLRAGGVQRVVGVTGATEDPTEEAVRFSPVSNDAAVPADLQTRVLVTTDVLSEGQNLQDAHVVVNYDLPWAIIRLVQRAGRVDRIGQQAERILAYSFLPAEGVERIINLRGRVQQRLAANDEVIGSDELFFEDSAGRTFLRDLYNEKAGVLDDAPDEDVDLASQAYQIWTEATDEDPALKDAVEALPPVVYATQMAGPDREPGALVYLRTAEGYDALTWVNRRGERVTESQFEILRAARCEPDAPALPRTDDHHALVEKGVRGLLREGGKPGGQLGRPSSVRARTYHRLKAYAREIEGSLFQTPDLDRAIEEVYRAPLTEMAEATLKRHLSHGLDGRAFAGAVAELRDAGDLVQHLNPDEEGTAQIICSVGLAPAGYAPADPA
ncbi:helicase-related protein [Rubrivirga marina]|uniref:NgoFVII family restriction endonuclease n=1 Tax=Rubrivirga marina TaxID=1196024 RepID=A0A271IZZ6_9BACT|nr:helicase-related protein [Rubrivirga marina]PAP76374.1 NgoFVII family restriction endonuclease [Rubrivirga marina]